MPFSRGSTLLDDVGVPVYDSINREAGRRIHEKIHLEEIVLFSQLLLNKREAPIETLQTWLLTEVQAKAPSLSLDQCAANDKSKKAYYRRSDGKNSNCNNDKNED